MQRVFLCLYTVELLSACLVAHEPVCVCLSRGSWLLLLLLLLPICSYVPRSFSNANRLPRSTRVRCILAKLLSRRMDRSKLLLNDV